MKHWMLFLLMVLGSTLAFSQQGYFVYLQTDNHQPFYVRLNEKVYSSTASGYLIIPRLPDTALQLIAGFPANAFPEQYFNIDIRHKDAGYLLRNFNDKGWGLFNLQSLAVTMNSNASVEKKSPEISVTKKTDAFSTLLAHAVNDTSILYVTRLVQPAPVKPVVVKAEPAKDTAAATPQVTTGLTSGLPPAAPQTDTGIVAKTGFTIIDSAIVVQDTPLKPGGEPTKDTLLPPASTTSKIIKDTAVAVTAPVIQKETPPATAPAEKTNTAKVAELLTDTSYIAVFTDGTADKFDTVRISIPLDRPGIQIKEAPRDGRQPVYNMPETAAQKDSVKKEDTVRKDSVQKDNIAKDSAVAMPDTPTKTEQPKTVQPKTEPVKVADTPKKPEPQKDSAVTHDVVTAPADTLHQQEAVSKPLIPNSDCKALAWDSDIDKLRIKMMASKTDDDRIVLAKKLFKQKCLTVKQVKALSELFTSDEGKYKWFDASYPSVSDTANFSQLGELIKDNYYQSRFKAMLRH